MNDNTRRINNSDSDIEDSIRNEEYLLGFTSQYKTELYRDEELILKNDEINTFQQIEQNKKESEDSTTISVSPELNNFSALNQRRKRDLSRDDIFSFNKGILELYDKQRKMSSPLCDYLKGSDQFLSKMVKSTVDITHSQNFVKKSKFFGEEKTMNNMNNNIIENKNNINNLLDKNNLNNENNLNKNAEKEKDLKHPSFNNNNNQFLNTNNINNINNINRNYINNNLYLMSNNCPAQQIFNINYINLNNYPNQNAILNKRKLSYNVEAGFIGNYFNNILNQNNPLNPQEMNFIHFKNQPNLNSIFFSFNESQTNNKGNSNKNIINKNPNNKKVPKKPLDKRKGDWNCPQCNNLNFAFRVICNRCQLPKPNNLREEDE